MLLGMLRDVANVPLTSAAARTAARVAAGATVDEQSVIALCTGIAGALVDKQLVPSSTIEDARELLTLGIYALIKKWDLATAPLRIGVSRPLDWRMMTMAGAQLVAVELGIRAGAWLVMTGHVATTVLPMRDSTTIMTEAIKATNLSQGQLARESGVAETTLVRWKKGESRPSERQLEALSKHLPVSVLEDVRRSLVIATLVERLKKHIPDHLASDLWTGLQRVCLQSQAHHAARPREELVRTVVFGPHASPELVTLLLDALTDSEFHWRAPIDSALDWGARLEFVHGVAWRAAVTNLPRDVSELVFWKAFSEATPAVVQMTEAWAGAHPELAPHAAAIRELFEAAVALRQRRMADAVQHYRQAHAELPDEPGVARAVIDGMLRAGEPDEAIQRTINTPEGITEARRIRAAKQVAADQIHACLVELESLVGEGDNHPEMYLYVGVARFRAGDFVGAFDALELVLADKRFEHHALALDIAAACAFALRKNKRGEELARRANQVGVSCSYWWKRVASG
ncbi:MAG TPA: helix-turn-helix domain-containing protein [Kofleriaceae bacterium]